MSSRMFSRSGSRCERGGVPRAARTLAETGEGPGPRRRTSDVGSIGHKRMTGRARASASDTARAARVEPHGTRAARAALDHHQSIFTTPAPAMSVSREMSGSERARAVAQMSASNASRVKRRLVGVEDMRSSEIDRLIRGITEQVGEERADGPVQVDPDGAREQADFPDDRRRDVEDRLAPLARVEVCARFGSELSAAPGVKHQRVRVGDGRLNHVLAASGRHSLRDAAGRRSLTRNGCRADRSNSPRM